MADEKVHVYAHMMSEPSRAIIAFCKMNNIPHEVHIVDLAKGEQKSPEYEKINPQKKVPAIVHGDFKLFESHSILVYLARVFQVEDHWYPDDPKEQAKVNCYLHWHHSNLRQAGGYYEWKAIRTRFHGEPPNPEKESYYYGFVESSLNFIENNLSENSYVANTSYPTIADISCFCHMMMYHMVKLDFDAYPRIKAWMERLQASNQALVEVHEPLLKFIEESL